MVSHTSTQHTVAPPGGGEYDVRVTVVNNEGREATSSVHTIKTEGTVQNSKMHFNVMINICLNIIITIKVIFALRLSICNCEIMVACRSCYLNTNANNNFIDCVKND